MHPCNLEFAYRSTSYKKNERKKYNEETILTICLSTGVSQSSKKEGACILSDKNTKHILFKKKVMTVEITLMNEKKIVDCV
jgi:hypothetical protein